jgi:hypothetical protein
MTRRLIRAALLAFAASPAFAQDNSSPRYGPTWLPTIAEKRPNDVGDKSVTHATAFRKPAPLTVAVWADSGKLAAGHEYELRYQLRRHLKKGEFGPLLGTKQIPDGVAPTLTKGTYGDGWNGLQGEVDLTLDGLNGMTNLCKPDEFNRKDGSDHSVTLRVEAQLYDLTDKKYVTESKTNAAVLVVSMDVNNHAYRLETLAEWIDSNAEHHTDHVTDRLATLDDYDPQAGGVGFAIWRVLKRPEVKKETKLKLLAALPPEAIRDRNESFNFRLFLGEWAKGDDAELKAAAKKVLGEK